MQIIHYSSANLPPQQDTALERELVLLISLWEGMVDVLRINIESIPQCTGPSEVLFCFVLCWRWNPGFLMSNLEAQLWITEASGSGTAILAQGSNASCMDFQPV
jgi:hypothetical protein